MPLALIATGWLVACTFDASGLGECRSDGDCLQGRCIDRVCVAEDVGPTRPDTAGDPDLSSDPALDPDLGADPDLAAPDAVDAPDGDAGCTEGCDGQVAVTCSEDGVESRVDCDGASACPEDPFGCRCEAAACVPRVCEPEAFGCDEDDRVLCNADGSAFEFVETCALTDVCVGGSCVDAACEPDFVDCIEGIVVTCGDDDTLEIGPDCGIAGMRCDTVLGECLCGAGPACEPDEACSDPDDGDCLCDEAVCGEGELCDGADGCACGEGGPDCVVGVCNAGECECPASRFGADCGGVCPACGPGTCDDGSTGTGLCLCPPDTFGTSCGSTCSCQNGADCDDGAAGTGACTCQAGFFGTTCSGVCACQNGGDCADGAAGTGACTCEAGFFGTTCAGVCDCQNGGDCADGAAGNGACTCEAGFFGATCAGVCACQNGGDCADGAAGNGACTCDDGFFGATCAGVCDCENGASCEDGAAGTGVCTCTEGFYGTDCSNECACENGATCDDGAAGSGACTCTAGFYGADCDQQCDCQNGATCDDGADGTGACTCPEGFYGDDCTGVCDCENGGTCEDGADGTGACTCAEGFYGADCSNECACTNGTCDDGASGTGACTCEPGYFGADCDQQCDCHNGATCDDGATGSGACTCDDGFYGPSCEGVCACSPDTICDDGVSGDGSCDPPTPLFNVQRGTATIDGTTLTMNAGTSFVAPTGPAFIRLVNTRLAGMGRTSGGNTQNSNRWMAWIANVASDWSSVTFERLVSNDDCRVTWEIIEYVGPANGPNAMAVRARGELDYATTGAATATPASAIAGVVDNNDVVVFITGQGLNDGGNTNSNRGMSTAAWDVGTQRPIFTREETGSTATVSFAVVEFTGSNWAVQRIFHDHDSADAVETETITSVGDVSQAFIHAQYRSTLGQVDELGAEVWLSAANTVSFRLQSGASVAAADDLISVVWVVSNSGSGLRGLNVAHYDGSRADGTTEQDCWSETRTAVPDLDAASIFGETARASGANNNVPRGGVDLRLTGASTVSLCQSDNGATVTYRYSIVRWPSD